MCGQRHKELCCLLGSSVVGVVGGCSFSPGGCTSTVPARVVDKLHVSGSWSVGEFVTHASSSNFGRARAE